MLQGSKGAHDQEAVRDVHVRRTKASPTSPSHNPSLFKWNNRRGWKVSAVTERHAAWIKQRAGNCVTGNVR